MKCFRLNADYCCCPEKSCAQKTCSSLGPVWPLDVDFSRILWDVCYLGPLPNWTAVVITICNSSWIIPNLSSPRNSFIRSDLKLFTPSVFWTPMCFSSATGTMQISWFITFGCMSLPPHVFRFSSSSCCTANTSLNSYIFPVIYNRFLPPKFQF